MAKNRMNNFVKQEVVKKLDIITRIIAYYERKFVKLSGNRMRYKFF